MKKLLLSVMMITGMTAFAQETPKKQTAQPAQTATVAKEKTTEVKTTEVKQAQPNEQKATTTTTTVTKPATEAQPSGQTQPAAAPKKQ